MKQSSAEHFRSNLVAKEIAASPLGKSDNRSKGVTAYHRPAGGIENQMNIKELCDLLEIKSADKKEINTELINKLCPIIMRFNAAWPTASLFAQKGGRSEKELKYLAQKGLVYFHRKSDKYSNVGEGSLYKLTNKGVQAYKAYIAFMEK